MDSDRPEAPGMPEGKDEQPPTEAAGQHDEQPPTKIADPAAEGETQSINAWSLEDPSSEVTPYEHRSWKLPVIVAVGVVVVVAVGVGIWASSGHSGSGASVSSSQAAPPPPSAPSAPPLSPSVSPKPEVGGRMVSHSRQLEGGPDDWKAVEDDLKQQGVSITVNAVGALTHLEFADQNTAPGNWVRWYAKHIPSPPFQSSPSQPVAFLAASEAGLPVPPPPKICYANDGSPVPIAVFPGPYVNCGPTPGALAGH